MTEPLDNDVRVWEESVIIPTYRIGTPDKNPMFLEKRVYQGSSGVVYPHPIIDRVYDDKEDKSYKAVFLENRYLKIMLLPEIGGRVQMALDKTNGYHFVYYNRVIKPALVGLTGPWISGGIEFNWPQHHRPSTFEPVDYKIEANADGSQTVWLSEIERMFRTKGMAGFTLYPDRAYLEIKAKLYNRTPQPQTFLWWANPAVHVNEDYQSIFPPDVRAVMDHGKRDVSTFPIATGTYYKMDYSAGVDISRYKNIPVPTSFMAYHSDFDFLGSYDHGKQAGMLHIANHHVVPGKKQWTWGNSDFGQAWDRQLTDEDGPYIELMCGAYTDNQPDFSWIQPGEEKSFTQIFMPYKQIGGVKNANQDIVINLEIEGQNAQIGVYVTSPRNVTVILSAGHKTLLQQDVSLTPDAAYTQTVPLLHDVISHNVTLSVLYDSNKMIEFTPLSDEPTAIPQPAAPAKRPADIETNEELFLNGLHLEQYRHATFAPEPYYLEALRRDPLDSRCHTALGRLLFQRGKFAEAESHFRQAIESLTRRNPNPYDGEVYYQLGLTLKMQGRRAEAFDAFYKAVWSAAWQDSAYFELARLACAGGRFDEALELVDKSLARNSNHHQARHLKIALLRRMGTLNKSRSQKKAARLESVEALKRDAMNLGVWCEGSFGISSQKYPVLMSDKIDQHQRIEIALDYAHAGLFWDAIHVLSFAPQTDPMVKYFIGWMYLQEGAGMQVAFKEAAQMSPDYCFPNQIECVPALQAAMTLNPTDSYAPYYLGNFWYAHRCYDDAIACWEQSRDLNPNFATVHRNLGLAYVNKRGDLDAALTEYETAFKLNPLDGRVFFELDQLLKKRRESPQIRLERLEAHSDLVQQRDDLMIEYISLLNLLGRYDEALQHLETRSFHPWEGGEGKVTGQYVLSLVELAKQDISAGNASQAVEKLKKAQVYPPNLGEGKLYGAQENNIFYWLGCAYAALGDEAQANESFSRAAVGLSEPTSAVFYNDQPPDMIFYQGKARQALGQTESAQAIFQRLIDYGQTHLNDEVSIDYFAVSLPDFLVFDEDMTQRHQIHCHYMMALGYLGLAAETSAETHFQAVLSLNPTHQGAVIHQNMLVTSQR